MFLCLGRGGEAFQMFNLVITEAENKGYFNMECNTSTYGTVVATVEHKSITVSCNKHTHSFLKIKC